MANEFVIKNGLIIGGGGLQMSGSLAVTGSLNISSVVNAGTDTDKFLVLDSNGNVDFRTGAQVLSDIGAAASSVKNYIDFNNPNPSTQDIYNLTNAYGGILRA